jgi:DNA-binding GntR family transcriptional regulator
MADSDEIYRHIKAQIEGAKLAIGAPCPSENDLCSVWHVARGTVRRALRRLAQEGYLEVAQGRRRIVRRPGGRPVTRLRLGPERPPLHLPKLRSHAADYTPSFGEHLARVGRASGGEPRDDVLESPKTVTCAQLHEVFRLDVGEIMTQLQLRTGRERVIWFLRRRAVGELPVVLQWVVVPAQVVPAVAYDDLHPGGLTRLYREKYRIERHSAEAHYRPVLASREEARVLRIDRDAPLVEERRTSFRRLTDRGVMPYEYLLSLYTDRVSLDFSWSDAGPAP